MPGQPISGHGVDRERQDAPGKPRAVGLRGAGVGRGLPRGRHRHAMSTAIPGTPGRQARRGWAGSACALTSWASTSTSASTTSARTSAPSGSTRRRGANDRFAALRADIIRTIESQGASTPTPPATKTPCSAAWAPGRSASATRPGTASSRSFTSGASRTPERLHRPRLQGISRQRHEVRLPDYVDVQIHVQSRFRGAQMVDFEEYLRSHSTWFSDNNVQVAECWRITPSG